MKIEWWHALVAIIVILLLIKGVQTQAAFITNLDYAPCLSYAEAYQSALDKESNSEYTCVITRLAAKYGGCHPCSDPNMNLFDANKLYAVKCGHAYDFEINAGDLRGRFHADTRCDIDSDCADFEDSVVDDEESYQCGSVSKFPSTMLCIEGACKSYYIGCGPGDANCDGCISDGEFPQVINSWLAQDGITDNEFPFIVSKWINQEGC